MEKTAITNAMIYDGSGAAPVAGDLLIEGSRIAAIEKPGALAQCGFPCHDARGLALAPGFLDVHGHSDTTILQRPGAESRISQGVTTEVVGNCGSSAAIARSEINGLKWDSVAGYAEAVNSVHPAIHIATLAGHNTIRRRVLGPENVQPSQEQLKEMTRLLRQALEEGAAGFSSGLIYLPGKFSKTEELCVLASALRGTGKPYATHMRSEADKLLEALEEAFQIATAGDGVLEVSHIKTAQPQNWHKIDALLSRIEEARKQSLQVTADRYPYLYSGTGLRMCLPSPYDMVPNIHGRLLADSSVRKDILERWEKSSPDWDKIILNDTGHAEDRPLRGLTIRAIAERRSLSPGEACLELLENDASPQALYGKMCQENLDKIYSRPWVMPGSDGYAIDLDYDLKRTHPRSFGTCPRFFRMVSRNASIQETIRRMTSLPCSVFHIPQRGLLRKGYVADLVLFDPQTMDASQDFANPHQFSKGVRKTFVSGQLAFDCTNPAQRARAGHFLPL